jgi:hypothetical protein
MPANFETVQQLLRTIRNVDTSDKVYEKSEEKLLNLIPQSLYDVLFDLAVDSPEFEKAFNEWQTPPATAAALPAVRARRRARPEKWRVIPGHPYEISNKWRTRSVNRAVDADFLTPRDSLKFIRRGGKVVGTYVAPSVVIYTDEGKRVEREIFWLMVKAGWKKNPFEKFGRNSA